MDRRPYDVRFDTAFLSSIEQANWEYFELALTHPKTDIDLRMLFNSIIEYGTSDFYFRLLEIRDLPEDAYGLFLSYSLQTGKLDVAEDLVTRGYEFTPSAITAAVENGNNETLNFCLNHTVDLYELLSSVVDYGNNNQIEYLEGLFDEPINWLEILEDLDPEASTIACILAKINDKEKTLALLFERFELFDVHPSSDHPVHTLLDEIDSYLGLPHRYYFRREIAASKRRKYLLKKYGMRWFENWYRRSANPDGGGIVYENWKKRLYELIEESRETI